tara:strand:- start:1337 stop:2794 length:1458 start_codon:yes stop_codon:yes gene_type:complete
MLYNSRYAIIFLGLIGICFSACISDTKIYAPDKFTGKISQYTVQTMPFKVFPKDFLWGIATASCQIEEISSKLIPHIPHAPNTLTSEYLDRFKSDERVSKMLDNWQEPGESSRGYSQAKQLVDLAQSMGCNSYRFSIEWARVEPKPGEFNQEVIEHYVELCRYIRSKNMTPMVWLHHYIDPIWFMDKGGFTTTENTQYFIEYCNKMVDALSPYVDMFVVTNQATAYAYKGYNRGSQMPFIKDDIKTSKKVAHSMLQATCDVARHIRSKGKSTGVCHQHVQNEYKEHPELSSDLNDGKQRAKDFYEEYTKIFIDFFTNTAENKDLFDFVAVHYYSRYRFGYIDGYGKVPCDFYPHEAALRTDDGFRFIDGEGLYEAIQFFNKLFPHKPLYVVETGINTKDENFAIQFMNTYISTIIKAIQDGIPVKGLMFWTLIDNYEWGKNFTSRFGFFSRMEQKPYKRAWYYQQVINEFKKTYGIPSKVSELAY